MERIEALEDRLTGILASVEEDETNPARFVIIDDRP